MAMEAVRKIVGRLLAWVDSVNPATLQLTGILGLALVVIGYYHFKGGNDPPRQRRDADPARPQQQQQQQQQGAGARAAAAGEPGARQQQQQQASKPASAARDGPVARAVVSRLQGLRRVTLSCPGVLLQQWQPEQLTELATLCHGAAEIVREMCYTAEVFLIGHVKDDIGQALVSAALESAGVIGSKPGQVPVHRLLFCSTQEGKIAITRQLEAELHVDSSHTTVDGLQRFVPQLWFVGQPGAADVAAAPNVAKAASLGEFFGL